MHGPRRTGLGALPHPAPSGRHSQPCRLRETSQCSCHAQSPLSVGACSPNSLSLTAAPSLPPHYQRSSLLRTAQTSHHAPLLPRCLDLRAASEFRVRRDGISMVTARSQFKLDWASNPGKVRRTCQLARRTVVCWLKNTIDLIRMSTLSGLLPSHAAHHRHSTSLAFVTTHQSPCY